MAREWLRRREAAEHARLGARSIDKIIKLHPELACRPLGPKGVILISLAGLNAYIDSTRQPGKAA